MVGEQEVVGRRAGGGWEVIALDLVCGCAGVHLGHDNEKSKVSTKSWCLRRNGWEGFAQCTKNLCFPWEEKRVDNSTFSGFLVEIESILSFFGCSNPRLVVVDTKWL